MKGEAAGKRGTVQVELHLADEGCSHEQRLAIEAELTKLNPIAGLDGVSTTVRQLQMRPLKLSERGLGELVGYLVGHTTELKFGADEVKDI